MRTDDLRRENEALRERYSALNAAILRINASLDPDTVLGEVVASASQLTGACYCIVTTIDETGAHRGAVFEGFTAEERREMFAWPDKERLFEHLLDLPGPTRVADLTEYIRPLNLEPPSVFSLPVAFQGAPMHHRGEHLGHFFLGKKGSGESFTAEDEEVLTLFASQAAAAVANARVHRSARRARSRLEALVETSPVGVMVFDAPTGRLASVNREAQRLAEKLGLVGPLTEQFLQTISFRRNGGQEVSLREFPIADLLANGVSVRAEEIDLVVPDEQEVRLLVNSTLIRNSSGAVESMVVTLQDLAPLDEIERMRVEFLSLVSHELREPLTSIKGAAVTLLQEGVALEKAERHEFFRIIDEQADRMRALLSDLLDAGSIGAGTLRVSPEPVDVSELVEPARRAFLSGGGRHAIVVDLPAGLPLVMADRRRIVQVLGNLVANAARHAPESTPIRIAVAREDAHLVVSVADEGRGMAPEQLPNLFRKRAGDGKGALGGHGLGLVICKGLVEAHGGRIRAESAGPGCGMTVTFTIPAAHEPAVTAPGPVSAPLPSTAAPDEPARILVVDDDPRTLRFVRDALSRAGYAPLVTGAPEQLPHLIRSEKPQLVLLDLLLPGRDGIELLGRMPELSDQPVIFISAYGRDETIARALESGAADYIVKPFSPTELVARVRTALRRHAQPQPFTVGDLTIDYDRRRVAVGGSPVDLTATEYELLRVLSLHAGRVVTYETLLRRVWAKRENPHPNVVRIFVRNLRRKLGDNAAQPTYILNVRGVGYRMPEADEL